MKRSALVIAVLLLAGALFAEGTKEKQGEGQLGVAAGEFPTQTITIIAPAAAGGGTDLTARNLARLAAPILGVSVVVSNMPGGGNAIGITAGFTAKPDGYTLVLGQVETVLLPLLKRVDWQPEDFVPIMGVDSASAALTVPAGSRFGSVDDFVAYAKDHPNELKVGGSAPGTIWHLAAAGFERAAKVDLNIIPYSGGAAPAITDLLGGQLDAVTVSAGEVSDQLEAGNVKVLAIMRAERDPRFPDVPTMQELGYDAVFATWWALLAPPDTPESVQQKLFTAFKQAWDSDEFQNFLKQQRLEPMFVPPSDFPQFIQSEKAKFEPVIQQLGLS